MAKGGFAGTPALIRLIARLDRVKLTLWVVGLLAVIAITPLSMRAIIDSEAEAQGVSAEAVLASQAALLETNSASIALQGPADALDTFGGRYAFEIGAFTLAIIALMNILLIARYTRAEEESGRAELVRAAVVGRWSSIVAVGVVAVVANMVLGVGTGVVFAVDGLDLGRSFVYGATLTMCGLLFASFAMVWVQVFEYTRPATGMSLAGLAVAFAVRAVGDVRDNWVSALSPMGWVQAVNPFGGLEWWPFVVSLLAGVGSIGLTVRLLARRDVGAGLIGQRPGPPSASAALGTPMGFAWRLQRPTLVWWTVGVLFLGAIYGSVISAIDELVEENEAMLDVLEAMGMSGDELRDGFITVILSLVALIASAGVVQSLLRPRAEEVAGRAEPVLATALSRRSWLMSHVALTAVAAPIFMLAAGVGLAVSDALVVGEFTDFTDTIVASLARVPAMWAIAGVGLLFYGWRQRWSLGAWVVFTGVAVIFLFGDLMRLPDLLMNVSPIGHVTHLPGGEQSWWSMGVLCAVGVAAAAGGVVLFTRRDIDTS